MSDIQAPRLPKNRVKPSANDPKGRYEQAVEDFKQIFQDKLHPKNRTPSYDKNLVSVINRLLIAANDLEELSSGEGVYGLIILALRSSLSLKDKLIELQVENRELELRIKRLEKRE